MDRSSDKKRTDRGQRESWPPICSPQVHINHWLRLVETRFAGHFGAALKGSNVIASEWAALRELYRPGRLSPLDVGRAIGMSKGGASKLINRLVRKGLVKKTVGEFDRRCRCVEITNYGKQIVIRLASSEEASERQSFRLLRINGRHRLRDALKRALGAERKKYMNQWISICGNGGQWVFQTAWRDSVRRKPLGDATFSRSEQSLQLFGGQLTESSAG
jgi:DNA-binding MarR family transcriptional regulator